jgi:hypothetical protein
MVGSDSINYMTTQSTLIAVMLYGFLIRNQLRGHKNLWDFINFIVYELLQLWILTESTVIL